MTSAFAPLLAVIARLDRAIHVSVERNGHGLGQAATLAQTIGPFSRGSMDCPVKPGNDDEKKSHTKKAEGPCA